MPFEPVGVQEVLRRYGDRVVCVAACNAHPVQAAEVRLRFNPRPGFASQDTNGNALDGSLPSAPLFQGADGSFYGTTSSGGGSGSILIGSGVLFRLTPSRSISVLHSFNFLGTDGTSPQAGLIQDASGNLYGTTSRGGRYYSAALDLFGPGTVFKISTNGMLVWSVPFDGTNGYAPRAGLVQGRDGNFYGTTALGGALFDGLTQVGSGTIFRITSNGCLTTLYSFTGFSEPFTYRIGVHPVARSEFLAQVADVAELMRQTVLTSTNHAALPPTVATILASSQSWAAFFAQNLIASGLLDSVDLPFLPPPQPGIAPQSWVNQPGSKSATPKDENGCEVCKVLEDFLNGKDLGEAATCFIGGRLRGLEPGHRRGATRPVGHAARRPDLDRLSHQPALYVDGAAGPNR
jgi:uncharacterized repeat protein (TIGR03803 family)